MNSADLPFEYMYLIDDITTKGERLLLEHIYPLLGKAMFWLSGPATASQFWERAKNLIGKTVAGGGQPSGLLQQVFAGLLELLKRLYVVKRLRRPATARELSNIAQERARNRYLWYKESFTALVCDDSIKTILEPIIAYVDKYKATCDGSDAALEALYEANKNAARVSAVQPAQAHVNKIHPPFQRKNR